MSAESGSKEAEKQLYLAIFDDKLRRIPVGEGTLIIGRSRDVRSEERRVGKSVG